MDDGILSVTHPKGYARYDSRLRIPEWLQQGERIARAAGLHIQHDIRWVQEKRARLANQTDQDRKIVGKKGMRVQTKTDGAGMGNSISFERVNDVL
ncbi:hypothetical protein EW146_g6288 [Bondarzewia mesenterica]|uniref:Uncharacterized protein n=1 Tax=Bondarzewia mesenterica TaxID=1095465 RepID=A0A4V3XEL2_9AGAM|nr:hypothetical protein EW146_g6288 [Bondarzewia mesenterica]